MKAAKPTSQIKRFVCLFGAHVSKSTPGFFFRHCLSNIGDGGAVTNATLTHPQGVTFNAFGNLFIADTMKNRVRKVDINGIITTVAGTNMSSSFFGDGGAATNAGLNEPSGVACDAFGNLYIADMNHNRIRMVNTNGI